MQFILRFFAAMTLVLATSFASGADKGTLTIWVGNDKGWEGIEKVAQEYARKTGAKVKVQHFGNATASFEEAMTAGKGPDIWIWPHDRLGDWIKRGWIAPVTPDAALKQDIVQVAWDGFTQGGKTWGYPISVEAVALLYNKDLLAEPPKTFEEIAPLHFKLKAKGVRAIGWETESAYYTWPLLSANGGYVFQRKIDGSFDARDTGVAHPGAIRGAEYLAELLKSGVLPEGGMSYQDAEEGMKSGKQAMWITGPWAWDSLAQAKVNFGVALIPTLNGKPARPFVGVLGAMITAQSPNKAQAVTFLEQHLLKSSGLSAMNRARPFGVPASKTMFWSLYSDPRIRVSMDSIYAGRAMPNNTEMTLFWQHLTTALRDINGGDNARQALETAATNIRAVTAPGVKKKVAASK